MKFAIAAVCLLSACVSAPAQQLDAQKEYALKLSGVDIAGIAQALNEMPYKVAQPILEKLSTQTKPAPTEDKKGEPK